MSTIAQNKGFVEATGHGNEGIHRRYGNKTNEMVRKKRDTNKALFTVLSSILRYDELMNAGFDPDEVDFQTSSIRREIKEFYSRPEKTDDDRAFMARLDSPIQYAEDDLQTYEDESEVAPVLSFGRSTDEYLGGIRTVKAATQRQARENAKRKRNEPKRLIR
jgi:hypothetical protein